MKTNIARVCQIGTTNYVDYKGERYTVQEYNLYFNTNIRIPKDVKVCESEFKADINKFPVNEMTVNFKHGSRAKKACIHQFVSFNEKGPVECMKCLINTDDIDVPTLRKVEFEEAIEAHLKRNPNIPYFQAICIAILLASIIIHSLK